MKNRQPASGVIAFPHGSDSLESAGTAAFEAIRRAAAAAEETTQRALSMAHKTTLQLRAAEERIAQLEADVQQAKDRARRAEQWLHRIVAEIEERFSVSMVNRNGEPPPTSPNVYAPKRRVYEGLETQIGDLIQSRPARSG